jgi:hypothetical protein
MKVGLLSLPPPFSASLLSLLFFLSASAAAAGELVCCFNVHKGPCEMKKLQSA